jgi:ParB/RepB/Spo0J family partition protein
MSIRVKLPAPIVPRPADSAIAAGDQVMDGYCDLPLWLIRASRTNRTYFNIDALQQLAANIADVGILQPILVRPVPPTDEVPQPYEIVAGERRFRAAVLANLAVVPVRVLRMTDQQAAELQLVENLQREDPHPLEEAEGMQTLMLNHGYNADQLAAAVKQSRSYIYARLKLCDLATSVREQFMGEQFNASIGLLIARLPTPALQAKAATDIQRGGNYGEPMSFRAAQDYLRRNYMLDLKQAVFSLKDAKLVEAAGACVICPKRAGNQPEIYTDEKDANICTEPACYREKTAAVEQQKRDQAVKKGMPIIAGDAAKKIMLNSYGALRGGYSDLDKKMYLPSGATSYREILGKGLPQVSLLENPHERGKYLEVARTDDLEDLVEAKAGKGKTEASQAAAAKSKEKKQEREAAIERQYRKDLFTAVRVVAEGAPHYDEREVAVIMFRTCYDQAETFISKFWGWDDKALGTGEVDGRYISRSDKIAAVIRSLDPTMARQLIRDLVLARDLGVNTYTAGKETPELLLAAAREAGIDAAAIRDDLTNAAKAKDKEKADKAKKSAKKAAKPAQREIAIEQAAGQVSAPAAWPFPNAQPGSPADDLNRKTLKLKPRAASLDDAAQPAGPTIRAKKPARTITVPGNLAYTAPDADDTIEQE